MKQILMFYHCFKEFIDVISNLKDNWKSYKHILRGFFKQSGLSLREFFSKQIWHHDPGLPS